MISTVKQIAHFRVALSLSIKARPGAQPLYENEFNLHVNEISFSYEKMSNRTRFEEEAKGIRKWPIRRRY